MKILSVSILMLFLISLIAFAQPVPSIKKIELSVKHTFSNAKVEIKQLKDRTIIDGNYYIGVEVHYDLDTPEVKNIGSPQSYLLICDKNLAVKQTFKLEGVRFFDRFELVNIDGNNKDDLVIIGAELIHTKKIWIYLRDNDKFNLIFVDECMDGLDFFINENNEKYIVKYYKKYGPIPPPKGEEYDKEYYIWNGEKFIKRGD